VVQAEVSNLYSGELYKEEYHDPDFAGLSPAHQVV